jgi:predicted nucleic acid-binding protein
MKVFLDTNVLIDVLARREPFYAASSEIWRRCETNAIEGAVAAITFDNLHYILTRLLSAKQARDALRKLRGIFSIVTVDAKIVNQALDSDIADFEDAIQYHCWLRSKARYLLTRNVRDFPRQPKRVVEPATFIARSVL